MLVHAMVYAFAFMNYSLKVKNTCLFYSLEELIAHV